jgi:multisubunit Na+/H+ antiporter MnhG subunit
VLWAVLLIGSGLALFWGTAGIVRDRDDYEAQDHTLLRASLGLLLAIAGVVFVLTHTIHFRHVGAIAAATATALAVLALVVGPWRLRTRRLL